MTTTKINKYNRLRFKERQLSRIKLIKKFIVDNTTTCLLNNQKWFKVFEFLDGKQSEFQLKTLLSDEMRCCKLIRELEETSILIDDSGDFFEFLEIDVLSTKENDDIKVQLDYLKIDYFVNEKFIEVHGYIKK